MSDLGNKKIFSGNLKYYMELKDKNRQQICDDLKIKYSTFCEWVSGKKYPRIDKIELLANYFKIKKSDLIEDKKHDSNNINVVNMGNINEIIKNRRKELNMSMHELATKTGVSEGTVSRWESGNIVNMKRDKIVALAKALQISPSVIMGWEDMPFVRLTKQEEQLIIRYRDNPQMQDAINKLLGI